jgi:hypothetical protein
MAEACTKRHENVDTTVKEAENPLVEKLALISENTTSFLREHCVA